MIHFGKWLYRGAAGLLIAIAIVSFICAEFGRNLLTTVVCCVIIAMMCVSWVDSYDET